MKIKKSLVFFILIIFLGSNYSYAYKGSDENQPYVQSSLDGRYYVRSIPEEKVGEKGATELYAVKKGADELIDRYDIYMKGSVFVGWSPSTSKFSLIHLEKKIIMNENWMAIMSRPVSRLVFYQGGKKIKTYSEEDLSKLGLIRPVEFSYGIEGDYVVKGIEQVPNTNDYLFSVEKPNKEIISFDITTGSLVSKNK